MYLLIIIIIIATIFGLKIYSSLTCGMCTCDARMDNKVVVVTGANSGIGYETARELARRGARVILGCRNAQKGSAAADSIRTATGNNNVVFKQLDLCSLRSVRNFAEDILKNESRLDVLINNAGIGLIDNALTEDNLPIEVQSNYFGPFLLTVLLLPLLKKSAPSRIINVSSILHLFGKVDVNTFHKQTKNYFHFLRLYSDTKLANILFTFKLADKLKGTGVTANSLHPGAVKTDIFRHSNIFYRFLVSLVCRSAWEGAQTVIHLAVSPKLKETTGKYFVDCCESKTARRAQDKELAHKLWDFSYEVTRDKKSL